MILYKKGNLFEHVKRDAREQAEKKHLILHIVNNKGGWGAGFVNALSLYNENPEEVYRQNWKNKELGDIQIVRADLNVGVVNMFCQDGYKSQDNPRPVSYKAIAKSLKKVVEAISSSTGSSKYNTVIHMPKIGSGLGGGDWEAIETIINLVLDGFEVIIYELK